MYQVGRVPDHVHRSYKEHNRWMYVPEVREPFTVRDLADILITLFALGVAVFAVCMVMAMYVQM